MKTLGTCSSVQNAITVRVLAAGWPIVKELFGLTPLSTKLAHLFRMVVIVRKCVINGCDFEIKLIGGICRCVSTIKNEFGNIEDANARLRDPRLTVESVWGLYDCHR